MEAYSGIRCSVPKMSAGGIPESLNERMYSIRRPEYTDTGADSNGGTICKRPTARQSLDYTTVSHVPSHYTTL